MRGCFLESCCSAFLMVVVRVVLEEMMEMEVEVMEKLTEKVVMVTEEMVVVMAKMGNITMKDAAEKSFIEMDTNLKEFRNRSRQIPVSSHPTDEEPLEHTGSGEALFLRSQQGFAMMRLPSPNRALIWKKSFLLFLFSLPISKGAPACKTGTNTKEFSSPKLNSKMNTVTRGQSISLICSIQNSSLQIKYLLFRNQTLLHTQHRTGEPMVVNLTVTEARDLGPYKCKAMVANCSKYSHEFNFTFVSGDPCPSCLQWLLPGSLLVLIVLILILAFWILPKYKARHTGKATREKARRDAGKAATERGIYANTCPSQADDRPVPVGDPRPCVSTAPDEPRHSQEIHYAAPVFPDAAPRHREAGHGYETACVYSELAL
ncbi:PREDICTED: allergin-1 [Condylura cristata]|uniref:allergin-1 n=1 Tax=Condylura cristata TaxID=143302 RepID=UPI000643C975|nr:PREDICTED: allergin-1 [Condylura cristata]